MKKYISIISAALVACSMLSSCDKETEGLTGIIYYPVLTLEGGSHIDWEVGVPFVDPGYSATLGGEDVTATVEVSTALDYENPAPGLYNIVYTAVNAEGFSTSKYREIYVWDWSDPLAGYYLSSPDCYRDYNGQIPYGGFMVTVLPLGQSTYWVSDIFGGWYADYMNYGSDYAMQGWIGVDGSDISIYKSYVPTWAPYGYCVDAWSDGIYDETTGQLSWRAGMQGLAWQVYLNKIVEE